MLGESYVTIKGVREDTFMTSQWLQVLTGLGIGLAIVGGPGRTAVAADADPCKPNRASVIDAYKLGDPTKNEYVMELGDKLAVALDKPTEFLAETACRCAASTDELGQLPHRPRGSCGNREPAGRRLEATRPRHIVIPELLSSLR